MDKIYLPVTLLKQDPKSDDCGRCCLWMILNFLGNNISKKEIWKKLHVYKNKSGLYGAYVQDEGIIALKRGFKATIFHYDWTWWNKEVVNNKNKILALDKFLKKQKKPADKKLVNKEINFIKAGGKLEFIIPNLETIENNLKNKTPILLLVNAATFYEDPNLNYGHAIVVTGYNQKEYFIADPYKEIKTMTKEKLLTAWTRNGGWGLIIERD